jgi:hypothetical protein
VGSSVQYDHAGTRSQRQTNEQITRKQQDRVTISQHGLLLSNGKNAPNKLLQNLMEQKQAMLERRNNYSTDALEKGTDPKVIKERLEEMDKQIEEIDTQMRQIELEEQRKSRGMDEESKDKKASDPAKQQDAQTQPAKDEQPLSSPTMHAVLTASNDLKYVKHVKSAQTTLKLESKAWEPASPDGDFSRSMELKQKAEALDGKMLKMAGEINKEIENAQEAEKAEQAERSKSHSPHEKQLDEEKRNLYQQQRPENQHISGATVDWIA